MSLNLTTSFRRWFFAVLIAAGAVFLLLFFLDARNRATLRGDVGWTSRGEHYGVIVGMPIENAERSIISAGFAPETDPILEQSIVSCGGYKLGEGERAHLFRERTWRDGNVAGQTVTNQGGETPLSYQRGYRDPIGRSIRLELRRAF